MPRRRAAPPAVSASATRGIYRDDNARHPQSSRNVRERFETSLSMKNAEDLSCAELVELVSDYIEDALTPEERAQFDEHLRICGGCTAYLDQMRTTIELTGKLRLDDLTPAARAELLNAFRDWRTSPR